MKAKVANIATLTFRRVLEFEEQKKQELAEDSSTESDSRGSNILGERNQFQLDQDSNSIQKFRDALSLN